MWEKILDYLFKEHSFLSSEFILVAGVITGFFFSSAYGWALDKYIGEISAFTGGYFTYRQTVKATQNQAKKGQ